LHEASTISQPFRGQVGRQLQGWNSGALLRIVFQAEGVVESAEAAAALAGYGLLSLMQAASHDNEGRQLPPAPPAPGPYPPRRPRRLWRSFLDAGGLPRQ